MKGLIFSWLYNKKWYFISGIIVFVAVCAAMLILLPLIDIENISPELLYAVKMGVFILGAVVMLFFGESLDKDFEHMLKSRFADYALTAGMTKMGFVNAMLIRNLICMGISLVTGSTIMCLYLALTKQPFTAEMLILVPCVAVTAHSVDFIVTPLVVKFKNAEKAGLIVGLVMGVIVFNFMVVKSILGEDVLFEIMFRASTLLIIAAAFAVAYIPAYIITLRMVKRGDLC